MFFFENHTQNAVGEASPKPFLKNQNWAHLWINSLKYPTGGLQKFIKTKLIIPGFDLI